MGRMISNERLAIVNEAAKYWLKNGPTRKQLMEEFSISDSEVNKAIEIGLYRASMIAKARKAIDEVKQNEHPLQELS